MEIEQRFMQFGAEYEDFEADEIGNFIVATGGLLEGALGSAATGRAMKALYKETFGHEPDPNEDWRSLWMDFSSCNLQLLPTSDALIALNGYAFWGLPLDQARSADENGIAIDNTIQKLRAFLDAIPREWIELPEAERTVRAAECRWRLDHNQNVTPEQLGALARIGSKRLKNLLTPSNESGLSLNGNGEILAATALGWLTARGNFKTSLWHEIVPVAEGAESSMPVDLGPVVFVPVAKDGSWFSPDLKRSGHYIIGQKGCEEHPDDYWIALDKLSRMFAPRWRRPNGDSNWGIVSGVRWERRSVAEIGLSKHRED